MGLFKKVIWVTLFYTIPLCFLSFSQDEIQNLEAKLKSATDKERMDILCDLTKSCLSNSNINKAQQYANEALDLAKKQKNKKAEGTALQYLGNVFETRNEPQEALKFHEASLKIREEISDTVGRAKSMGLIGLIYFNWGNYEKAILYYTQCQKLKEELGDQRGNGIVLNNIGNVYMRWGIYKKALEYYQRSLSIFEKIDFSPGITSSLIMIAMVQENFGNYEKALEFYKKALKIAEGAGNIYDVGNALNNIGVVLSKQGGEYEKRKESKKAAEYYLKSVEYYEKALAKRREMNDKPAIASSLNNIGTNYLLLHKYDRALVYYTEAYRMNEEINNQYDMVVNLQAMGRCYAGLKDYTKALEYLRQSIELSDRNNMKDQLMLNYEAYSKVYENIQNYKDALKYYKLFKEVNDTIFSENNQKAITEMQTKYETEKKEQQIKLKNAEITKKDLENKKQRIIIYAVFGGLILVVVVIIQTFLSLQRKKRDNKIIAEEKAKSEALLLNTLPEKVVHDLKTTGKTEPEVFDSVSVYFSDICGFTDQSSRLEPALLIGELNDIFTAFDDIMYRHGCERIKTIGDAYMAVCGMPEIDENHATNIVNAAMEIKDYLNNRNETHELQWRIRIGINSGKVTGGIVGVRKYLYDVFGDTVNTASRMESNSEPMRINCSAFTYELLKDKFRFIEREPIAIKGKGMMKMYFCEEALIKNES
jgi:adenylate cyclase